MRRLWVVTLVGALLVAAAVWSSAEARAPGIVQLIYISFLTLFGAALAAGVGRRRRQHELLSRVKRGRR